MLNKVMLIGYVGADSEMKFSQQGKPVCTFSLAVNERWKDAAGAPGNAWSGFKSSASRRLAEVCGEYLNKGRHVYLEGRLQTRKWKGPRRRKAHAIEVVANQMQILDGRPRTGTVRSLPNPRSPRSPSMRATTPLTSREARRRIKIPF